MCEIYVHIMDVCIMRNYQRLKGCIRSAQKQRLEIIVFRCSAVSKAYLENDNHWNLFADKIEMLFDKHENVDITTMGFTEKWKEILKNEK